MNFLRFNRDLPPGGAVFYSADPARSAWVLSGAPVRELPSVPAWIPQPDKVVAADGGSMLADRLGIVPHLIVGDGDSIDVTLLAHWREAGIPFAAYEHRLKAETDTELAALAALQWQPEYLVILGALGGRLDHTLANILLLTHPALADTQAIIVGGNEYVFLA